MTKHFEYLDPTIITQLGIALLKASRQSTTSTVFFNPSKYLSADDILAIANAILPNEYQTQSDKYDFPLIKQGIANHNEDLANYIDEWYKEIIELPESLYTLLIRDCQNMDLAKHYESLEVGQRSFVSGFLDYEAHLQEEYLDTYGKFDVFSTKFPKLKRYLWNNECVVKELIPRQKFVNEQDEEGNTLLMHAVSKNYLTAVKYILEIPGVGLTIRNRNNETAISLARHLGHDEIFEAIRDRCDAFGLSTSEFTRLCMGSREITLELLPEALADEEKAMSLLKESALFNVDENDKAFFKSIEDKLCEIGEKHKKVAWILLTVPNFYKVMNAENLVKLISKHPQFITSLLSNHYLLSLFSAKHFEEVLDAGNNLFSPSVKTKLNNLIKFGDIHSDEYRKGNVINHISNFGIYNRPQIDSQAYQAQSSIVVQTRSTQEKNFVEQLKEAGVQLISELNEIIDYVGQEEAAVIVDAILALTKTNNQVRPEVANNEYLQKLMVKYSENARGVSYLVRQMQDHCDSVRLSTLLEFIYTDCDEIELMLLFSYAESYFPRNQPNNRLYEILANCDSNTSDSIRDHIFPTLGMTH